MSNARLYGTPVATDIFARAVVRATKFEKQAGRKPCLFTVLVGHSDSGDLCFSGPYANWNCLWSAGSLERGLGDC